MSKGRVKINREGLTITRAWSILATGLLIAGLVLTSVAQAAPAQQAGTLDGMSFGVYLSPPLVDWYNQVARPEDLGSIKVAGVDLLGKITAGRRQIVFASAAEAEQMVPRLADQFEIIGYNHV